jgi:hypothetical protein
MRRLLRHLTWGEFFNSLEEMAAEVLLFGSRGADDHRVLTGERKLLTGEHIKFGGAAWLLYGLFCQVSFFPPLFSQASPRRHMR